MTFDASSRSSSCCSDPVSFRETFPMSSVDFCFSSAICFSSRSMFACILSVLASLVRFIWLNCCCSSSRLCSVSWEFWIRKRLDSSREVKTSSSCFGSWKYRGISSPLETSLYSPSTASAVGYRARIFLLRRASSFSRSFASSSCSRAPRRRRFPAPSSAFCCISLSSASISDCIDLLISAMRRSTYSCLRSLLRSIFWSFVISFHSCGVSFVRKPLNLRHSSFCSRCFAISLWMALSWDLSALIVCILSCFFLVMSSACFMALCALASLFCRKASNRVTSSSSICCDFLSASSFCLAFSSSFRISAFFTSKLIWTRNISRFFATKSATFSFFSRRSWPMPSEVLVLACRAASAAMAASSGPSAMRRGARAQMEEDVVFSQTCCFFTFSRSSARRSHSCSRSRKISSSGGSLKGLPPSSSVKCPIALGLR
mmetsp:Transcript_4791/g.14042  ORF Transcript_4791/g.14042 Transcript_4791/m.14042 type:complete len:430 (-) Transcript_4791:74-1363(-)